MFCGVCLEIAKLPDDLTSKSTSQNSYIKRAGSEPIIKAMVNHARNLRSVKHSVCVQWFCPSNWARNGKLFSV